MKETIPFDDFYQDFMSSVLRESQADGTPPQVKFIEKALESIKDTNAYSNPCVFYWQGNLISRGHAIIEIYGYDFDESDQTLTLFGCDYNNEEAPHTIDNTKIQAIGEKASRFIREATNENKNAFKRSLENQSADLYDLLQDIILSPLGLNKIRVAIFSSGIISSRIKSFKQLSDIKNVNSEIQVWDMPRLYTLAQSQSDHEETDINVADYPELGNGIPVLEIPQEPNTHFRSYLGYLPGSFLANIYNKFGSGLLENNVRSFLTTRTSVNKSIQGTIHNEPTKFFVYNNGIVITSSEIELAPDKTKITSIKNFQIINGGQTTASLAYAQLKGGSQLTGISVQMKLTVIADDDKEEYADTVQKISHSSNSQNKVNDADFFANHEFHKVMEKISKTTPATNPSNRIDTYWFYERSKGQYQQNLLFKKTEKEKKAFSDKFPKHQVVTKIDFAKYYNTLKQRPDIVSKGATTNFTILAEEIDKGWDIETSRAKYNEVFFKEVISVAIMFKYLEGIITLRNQDLTWYKGSYRANIITYSLSSLFYLVQQRFPNKTFNLLKIWKEQTVAQQFGFFLCSLAKQVYETITSPDRPTENVTQYCKKQECWTNVKQAFNQFYIPTTLISPYLADIGEYQSIKVEASKDKKLTQEVELLSKCLDNEHPKEKWESLAQFAKDHSPEMHYNDLQQKAVESIIKMGNGKQQARLYDCKLALTIWSDAEQLGWK